MCNHDTKGVRMDLALSELVAVLERVTRPEDLFGELSDDQQAALKRRYRELASVAHPDHNPGRRAEATEAFRSLQQWYSVATQRLQQGTYGHVPYIVATGLRQYTGYTPPLPGDLSDLFPVEVDGERVLLKVARMARDNDLLQREAQSL